MTAEDTSFMFSDSRLIRTELTTLIGLMMRAPIDFTLPQPRIVSKYIEQTETLLKELHHAIMQPVVSSMHAGAPEPNFFKSGDALREPIFYGAESAYPFQYRDLAPRKYRKDADWLMQNRGIDLAVGREVCCAIAAIIDDRVSETLDHLMAKPLAERTILPGFTFSCDELAARIERPVESVKAIIGAFAMPEDERNEEFESLNDFNAAYAYPLIRAGSEEFIMLQPYGISEAMYESPYYWMVGDDAYAPIASRHRGEFTEEFAADRLKHVFGADRVFRNVEIRKSKGHTLGEIDVLVVFRNRTIVVQAKSKKLTLLARKGNDRQLRQDFKAAVQDSVDQAVDCAKALYDPALTLICRDGRGIRLPSAPGNVFPISLVADHYPALSFQARQFLNVASRGRILPPLVIDVFGLDAMTEMLESPLRLLSYLRLRAEFGDKMIASHEDTLLSYHLKRNLWVADDVDLLMLNDDISADLDIAMAARRDGMPGARTPEGILTRFEGTPFAAIIGSIEDRADPVAIDLGLMLLELSEDVVREVNEHSEQVLKRTVADGGLHDMTIGLSAASCGLTIHCSRLEHREAEERLMGHCAVRKYSQKADCWFGIALWEDGSIRFAGKLIGPWRFDREMERELAEWGGHRGKARARRRVARNQGCPCGSGKKYKRCCMLRDGEGGR